MSNLVNFALICLFCLSLPTADASELQKTQPNINAFKTELPPPANSTYRFATLTKLKASPIPSKRQIVLFADPLEPTRSGIFLFNPSNLSGEVAADKFSTIYLAPDADPTGASGAWVRRWNEPLDVRIFGRLTDYSEAIEFAFTISRSVIIPKGFDAVGVNIKIPSDSIFIINGVLKLKNGSPSGSTLLQNADKIKGNKNIVIRGTGLLEGNKKNQLGTGDFLWHTLVDINHCNNFEFSVSYITGNFFPLKTNSKFSTGAVFVKNSNYVFIHDSTAFDYGREAFWLKSCNYSKMINLKAIGGEDSWSGIQFSGDYNYAENLESLSAGASGISFDCRYSVAKNLLSYGNFYFHGINFGHSGYPADGSLASDIYSFNAAQNGVNVSAGTMNMELNGVYVFEANGHGINVSDSATKINIINCLLIGNKGKGLNVYFGEVQAENCYFRDNKE